MIIGIGTDLCDIRRINKSLEKFGDKFTHKIFTEAERDYCDKRSGRASYYAKRFAAKEAVAKALAGEETGALPWQDVEVVNDPSGRPRINLYREAQSRMDSHIPTGMKGRVHLSLSDDYPYAQAYAIVEALPCEENEKSS